MSSEHNPIDSNHNPNDSAPRPSNGGGGAKQRAFAQHTVARATALASRVDDLIRHKPYAMLGIACAVGAGVGVLLSSRVLRAALTASTTAAAIEITRAVIRSMGQPRPGAA
jgi:hypothetical protein